ncbi:MAG: ATP-dependent Clp protease ATP-binding subunit ClpA [Acidobacteria bacterium]|nr:ATP-dependent Clp protease ATP-binding subunit ClpA [Acidobacteriota bacterium]
MNLEKLEAVLQTARREAESRRHEYVTLEHVLLAITSSKRGSEIILNSGGDPAKLSERIRVFLDTRIEPASGSDLTVTETITLRRLLEYVIAQAHGSSQTRVDEGNLLAAIYEVPDSHATWFLRQEGVEKIDVLNYVSHGISNAPDEPLPDELFSGSEDEDETESNRDPLQLYATDLNARAVAGDIDPLIGREPEVERVVQILTRRRKNNPILVGEPGVGKTAIAEGLARAIVEERVPVPMRDARVFSLDLGSLLAGTKYRGQFEQRLKGVIAALQNIEHAILFIDEIHTIVGAGATSSGTMDASNILKPALASGRLRCIGSTTFAEYKAAFDRDRALARRFQKVEILPPTLEDTLKILEGLRSSYEEHHHVRFDDDAIQLSAELAAKFLRDRHLPDSAIDVLDEAGARVHLLHHETDPAPVTAAVIEDVVARMAKVPPASVSGSEKDRLRSLDVDLKTRIFGQSEAIDRLVAMIRLSRAGLGLPDKPVGSFLFSGPTGVGKTELAKQLAELLGVELIRFDMSEYAEPHTVSRLIGAPPGYVGFDQGGLLTDAVIRTPHSVVVLDEIEKAHPNLFDLLLQVMDHATLTDNNGKKADFRNVVLIMTTNAGAAEISGRSLGFGNERGRGAAHGAIERTFSPEFRNRLDAWIAFAPLAKDAVLKIVDKFTDEIRSQLAPKGITLALTPEAREWLAVRGFDSLLGARPMRRLMQKQIKERLVGEILFGPFEDTGGHVIVDINGDELAIRTSAEA